MRSYLGILGSFLLPWTIGIIFFLKDKKIFATIVPFATMLAYILNTIGIDFGFFYPLSAEYFKPHMLAILANTGLLPVLSSIFIYTIVHTKIKPIISNIIITVIATSIDFIFIAFKLLEYEKGWNYMCSMIAYFISFSIIYFYYLWLKKLIIL